MSERMDEEIRQIVSEASGEPRADVKGRALEAMREVQPAARRPWRWAFVVAGAMALFGLGFVPIPMGAAPGALDRALAAAEEATTVHVVEMRWTDEGETVIEEWYSNEGFWRRDILNDGHPRNTEISVGPWKLSVTPDGMRASETFTPTKLHPPDPFDRSHLERQLALIRYLSSWRGEPAPDISITERTEASVWGRPVDIFEAQWTVTSSPDGWSGLGTHYPKGTQVLMEAEIDPRTGQLLSVREYWLNGRHWEQTYEGVYEWNVEISEELQQVELTRGATLTRYKWWESRAEQVLAQADTRDWTVTLHAIDIQHGGDVVLSLSRVETPDSEMPLVYNHAPPLVVEAVGSAGDQYEQQNYYSCYNARHSGYWTTTLKPLKPHAYPRAMTLTIWPYPGSPSEDQFVTFKDIPLPPRHDTDDLFAAETEVIQY